MKYQKKAQMVSQIFIYIMGLIVVGFIILYGYNAIKGFYSQAEQVTLIEFTTKLQSNIEKISSTINKEELTLNPPKLYDQLCFVDIENVNSDSISHPLIKNSVKDNVSMNIFLMGKERFKPIFIHKNNRPLIKLESPYFDCTNISHDKITLQLEGVGNGAKISFK